jgi:hypothetical protein
LIKLNLFIRFKQAFRKCKFFKCAVAAFLTLPRSTRTGASFLYHWKAVARGCPATSHRSFSDPPASRVTFLVQAGIGLRVHGPFLPELEFSNNLHSCPSGDRVKSSWSIFNRAEIFKQSMGARNRVGMGLSYRPARLHRLGGTHSLESLPGLHKRLKIRAQHTLWALWPTHRESERNTVHCRSYLHGVYVQ